MLLTDGNTITGVNVGSVRFLYTGAILVLCCDDTVLVFWLGSGTKAQLGSVEDYALTDTILMPQTQLESHLQCSVFFDCKFSKIYGFTALHTAGKLLTSLKNMPWFCAYQMFKHILKQWSSACRPSHLTVPPPTPPSPLDMTVSSCTRDMTGIVQMLIRCVYILQMYPQSSET